MPAPDILYHVENSLSGYHGAAPRRHRGARVYNGDSRLTQALVDGSLIIDDQTVITCYLVAHQNCIREIQGILHEQDAEVRLAEIYPRNENGRRLGYPANYDALRVALRNGIKAALRRVFPR